MIFNKNFARQELSDWQRQFKGTFYLDSIEVILQILKVSCFVIKIYMHAF